MLWKTRFNKSITTLRKFFIYNGSSNFSGNFIALYVFQRACTSVTSLDLYSQPLSFFSRVNERIDGHNLKMICFRILFSSQCLKVGVSFLGLCTLRPMLFQLCHSRNRCSYFFLTLDYIFELMVSGDIEQPISMPANHSSELMSVLLRVWGSEVDITIFYQRNIKL